MSGTLAQDYKVLCDVINYMTKNESKTNHNSIKRVRNLLFETFDVRTIDDLKSVEYFEADTHEYFILKKLLEKYNFILDLIAVFITSSEHRNTDLSDIYKAIIQKRKNCNKSEVRNCIVLLLLLNFATVNNSDDYSEEIEPFFKNNQEEFNNKATQIHKTCIICEKILKTKKFDEDITANYINEKINLFYIMAYDYINDIANSVNNTKKELDHLKNKLYTQILEIIGLLIAVFSIIGINLLSIIENSSEIDFRMMVLINISVLIAIAFIFGLISLIIDTKKVQNSVISLISFIVLIILFFICQWVL